MKFNPIYLENLTDLGYTEREAKFLYLVCIDSGLFTRAQFRSYCQVGRGRPEQDFVTKLRVNGHAIRNKEAINSPRRGQKKADVYHVNSRAIYDCFDNEDSPLRNRSTDVRFRQKLLATEFVIRHPELDYFETESAKLEFFTKTLNIPVHFLPFKQSRFGGNRSNRGLFPDKFPLAIDPNGTVIFTYLDDESEGLTEIKSHLIRYRPLWRNLPKPMRLYFVSKRGRHALKAREFFDARILNPYAEETELIPKLHRIFVLKKKQETGGPGALCHEEVCERGDLIDSLKGFAFQPIYERWKQTGEIDLGEPNSNRNRNTSEFVILRVKEAEPEGEPNRISRKPPDTVGITEQVTTNVG